MKLPVVVDLEEFFFPLLGQELLNGSHPDLDSFIYWNRLSNLGPNDACLTVWRSVYEIFILREEKQLFPHQAGHDLTVLNSSLAEQYVLCLESIFSEPGIKPQREVLIQLNDHADFTAGGRCSATWVA